MSKLVSRGDRRFLSFQKAREFAHTLGFTESKDWTNWARTEHRESDIPHSSSAVFSGYLEGYPDLLGCETRTVLRNVGQDFEEPHLLERHKTRIKGLQVFSDLVAEHAPEFQLMSFHYYSTISFLFRPSSIGGDDHSRAGWTPLVVRSAKTNAESTLQSRHMQPATHSHLVFGVDLSERHLHLFPHGWVLPTTVSIAYKWSKYHSFRFEPKYLRESLTEHRSAFVQAAPWEWLRKGFLHRTNVSWRRTVSQVWCSVYNLLQFPVDLGTPVAGASYNLFIDGLPVLQKSGQHGNLLRKLNGKSVVVGEDDDLTFVIIMINDEEGRVIGLYLFPKAILCENGMFRSAVQNRPGRRDLYIDPPLRGYWRGWSDKVAHKHSWKNGFFIDLTHEADILENKKRFLEIFTKYRPGHLGREGTKLPVTDAQRSNPVNESHSCNHTDRPNEKISTKSSSSRRKFLPFKEAREYARTLGFTRSQQWVDWARTYQRPKNIPFAPAAIYAGEFEGFADFCGYKSRGALRDLREDLKAPRVLKRNQTREEGLQYFADMVAKHAPEFELMKFHFHSIISFLVRRKDPVNSNTDTTLNDDWIPLLIRSAKNKVRGAIRFTNTHRSSQSHRVFGVDLSTNSLYLFPQGLSLPDTIIVRNGTHDSFLVDPGELRETLMNYLAQSSQGAPWEWLENGFLNDSDILWGKCVGEVWRSIYDPLQLSVEFASSIHAKSHNVIVDGMPILQKTASLHKLGKMLYVNMYRSINTTRVTLADDDDFAFVLVMTQNGNGNVSGFYLFPKEILDKESILRSLRHQRPGVRDLCVYPPLTGPWKEPSERVLKRHEWKNEYFIDLTGNVDIEESRNRFLEIFTKYRPKLSLA